MVNDIIIESLYLANREDIELPNIKGFSGKKVKNFLNNLIRLTPNPKYFEIGVMGGCTFVSALYNNHIESAVAVDNWSQFRGAEKREEFYKNLSFIEKKQISKIKIIEKDFNLLKKEEIGNPNIFFYDGHHSEESTRNAVDLILPLMDKNAIIVVDDYSLNAVRRGLNLALARNTSIKTLKSRHILYQEDTTKQDENGWWNGIGVVGVER